MSTSRSALRSSKRQKKASGDAKADGHDEKSDHETDNAEESESEHGGDEKKGGRSEFDDAKGDDEKTKQMKKKMRAMEEIMREKASKEEEIRKKLSEAEGERKKMSEAEEERKKLAEIAEKKLAEVEAQLRDAKERARLEEERRKATEREMEKTEEAKRSAEAKAGALEEAKRSEELAKARALEEAKRSEELAKARALEEEQLKRAQELSLIQKELEDKKRSEEIGKTVAAIVNKELESRLGAQTLNKGSKRKRGYRSGNMDSEEDTDEDEGRLMGADGQAVYERFVKHFSHKYRPGKTPFVMFLNRFRNHMRVRAIKLNDHDKGELLRLCLDDIATGTVEGYFGYKNISRQLKSVYGQDRDNLWVEMQKMEQEEGEKVSKWINRVHQMALELRAVDPNFREEDERDILLKGMVSWMKEKMLPDGKASLEDFKARALQLESTYARFWAEKDEATVSKTQVKKLFAAGALPQPATSTAYGEAVPMEDVRMSAAAMTPRETRCYK